MDNPFEIMNEYSVEDLEQMSLAELLRVQRSVLFPKEQEVFDQGESIYIEESDSRAEFLDFTDELIVGLTPRVVVINSTEEDK